MRILSCIVQLNSVLFNLLCVFGIWVAFDLGLNISFHGVLNSILTTSVCDLSALASDSFSRSFLLW